MPASKAHMKATNKYNQKAYCTVSVRVKRTDGIWDKITQAAADAGVSKATWIYNALSHELERQAKESE